MKKVAACEAFMNREIAQDLIDAALKASRELHAMIPLLKQALDEDEYDYFAKGLASASAAILEEVINPVFLKHPELAPSGMAIPKS